MQAVAAELAGYAEKFRAVADRFVAGVSLRMLV
jgi:hypothetical protein